MYVFAYGSLMNQKSLWQTLPEKEYAADAVLGGYRLATSKLSAKGFLFMNLIHASPESDVTGKLIEVGPREYEEIRMREQGPKWIYRLLKFLHLSDGYDAVEITSLDIFPTEYIDGLADGKIIAFIAPSHPYFREYRVLRSYLVTCLQGVKTDLRAKWLEKVELGGEIIEDMKNPLYGIKNKSITKTKVWN